MKKLFYVLFFGLFLISCIEIKTPFEEEKSITFLFLYTNDEHGHIYETGGWYKGSVLYEMWDEEEKNCKGCTVFRLSGGDSFTGTAVSSFFNGEPVAKIMGMLRYKFSAVGNHEFDFGTLPFEKNRAESGMEYLSSNIVSTDLKTPFRPSLIYVDDRDGKVSFVGATTREIKQISFASYLKNFMVVKPGSTVGRELKKNKPFSDFQVVVTHEPAIESKEWVKDLEIKPLIVFGGHDHVEVMKNYDDVLFVQTEGHLKSYARVEVQKKGKSVKVTKADIVALKKEADFSSVGSKKIKDIIDSYLEKLNRLAGQKLIISENDFEFESFQKLYACCLLNSYPGFDAAMSNPGAFRDVINQGVIKKSDIISMLPFQNRVVLSAIKGEDLIYNLNLSQESYCGVTKQGGDWFVKGELIKKDETYKAVIHEYIYSGGDYYRFILEDAKNEITSKDWREPLERYLAESSSKGLKLEEAFRNLMGQFAR
jgi:5'-nucleotidase / UDP-sugar diphosphatase